MGLPFHSLLANVQQRVQGRSRERVLADRRQRCETALWHTHHDFYEKSRRYVSNFRQKEGRVPTAGEFRHFALGTLDKGRD